MSKILNLAESGLQWSQCFLVKKSKLVAPVTGAAVMFTGLKNAVFPPIDDKKGLYVAQICAHRYHTINSNANGIINGVLRSMFSAVINNDTYSFSGMLKQPDGNKCVEAMLVKTVVREKRNHWSTIL